VEGAVFRSVTRHGRLGARLSDRAVALIVKRRASLAGLNAEDFSGHSLRAGFATSAARAGLPEPEIMRVTRHRSVAVLRRYVREGDLFARNVTNEIGL
jgi:integrase